MHNAALNQRLLNAHAAKDSATIVSIYRQTGEAALQSGDIQTGCFYLTHAYVFALEAGLDVADDLHRVLKQHGREE